MFLQQLKKQLVPSKTIPLTNATTTTTTITSAPPTLRQPQLVSPPPITKKNNKTNSTSNTTNNNNTRKRSFGVMLMDLCCFVHTMAKCVRCLLEIQKELCVFAVKQLLLLRLVFFDSCGKSEPFFLSLFLWGQFLALSNT